MDMQMHNGHMTTTADSGAHFHPDDPSKQSEHSAAHSLITSNNATHTAVKSGSWFNPSTWKGGRVPGADAKVIIPKGLTVKYDDVSDTRLFGLRVDGQLDFATNADTKMVIDTFVVSSDGTLTIGTKNNPVQGNVETQILIADNGKINTKWDPQQLSRGIISHGTVSIHGQEKTSHLKVSVDPGKGDSTLVLESTPDNWKVGDRIILTGTQYVQNGTQDEERTITSINGNRLTLDKPLSYDHGTPKADLKAYVANQSRNVTIATENANKLPANQRGHIMFMHSDNVDVRYAEFNELGRTDKSKPLDDFLLKNDAKGSRVLDKNGDPISGKSTNIRGRYAVHLHRTGVNGNETPAVLIGNSVVGSPGWGIVQHDSYAVIEDNVSYDIVGSGFVSETGNEIGAWRNNISIKNQGRSDNEKSGEGNQDLGFAGHGFWFQSRSIENEGNIAAGNSGSGFFYFHRGVDQIDIEAENLAVEAWAKGQDTVKSDEAPITGFKNNEVFASDNGLRVIKNFQIQGHDGRTVLDGLKAWEVAQGTELQYTSHYTLKDFELIGSDYVERPWLNDGVHLAQNVEDIVFDGLDVTGFDRGVNLKKESIGVKDVADRGYIFIDEKVTNNKQNWINLDRSVDRFLDRKDIKTGQLNFNLDKANSDLVLGRKDKTLSIVGTKTDSLGTVKLPFGTDTLDYSSNGTRNLGKSGYYTLPDGNRGVVIDEYISDRLTGDVRKYSFVVTFSKDWNANGARNLGPLDPNKIKQSSGIIPFEQLAFNYGDNLTHGNHSNDHEEPVADNPVADNPVTDNPAIDSPSVDSPTDNGDLTGEATQNGSKIVGTSKKDSLNGTAGNDTIDADGGADTVSGGNGNDIISGGWGRDTINGGAGNDTIDGGPGQDTMTGGAGRDVFIFKKEGQIKDDIITDFETGVDQLNIQDLTSFTALDTNGDNTVDSKFLKQLGDGVQLDLSSFGGSRIKLVSVSTLTGENFLLAQGDSLAGGSSTNIETEVNSPATPGKSIDGDQNANVLTGTAGDDTIDGQGGSDTILGNNGNDLILGGWGADKLNGGAGNDKINGGPGKNTLTGGAGRDEFVFAKVNQSKTDVITDFERGIDQLDVSDLVSFGSLDANNDGLVDNTFVTSQGNGLLLDLSASGGNKVSLDNVDALSSSDFV